MGDAECLTIGYAIIGEPGGEYGWVEEIMRAVAVDNQLLY
jgi:hypothetical protein